MIELKIGGVPEHFNLPWRLAIEEGLFEKENIILQWIDHAGGTGSMTKALREKELDLAICLTEGIVADIVAGNGAKIVKIYVKSPLTWGLYVKKDSLFRKVSDLENKRIGISRLGSGSHLMAFVKARDLGWDTEKMQFVALKNLEGIRVGIAQNQADWFMWEKVMTQPYVDSGELRLIDTCVTPWSCFVLVVREDILQKCLPCIRKIAQIINLYVEDFKKRPRIIELLAERYQIDLEDTAHWLHQTQWATDNFIPPQMIAQVQETLLELKIIQQIKPYEQIVQVLD
ncbi:ABC transporter substrate-binding protein [Raineya sp.]|jgi:ABC-type nitrate/sulfonate/bicarbonate transport system substrate-binding protein